MLKMREEMGKNEEVVARQQSSKVMSNRINPRNIPRRVSPFWIIFWLLLALASLSAWLMRLTGILHLN